MTEPNDPLHPPIRFVALGTVEPRKNQVETMRAFARLCARRPDLDLRLDVVGNVHPVVAAVAKEIARRHKRIRQCGWRSRVAASASRSARGARSSLLGDDLEGDLEARRFVPVRARPCPSRRSRAGAGVDSDQGRGRSAARVRRRSTSAAPTLASLRRTPAPAEERDTVTRLRPCPPLMSDRESDIEFDFFEESDTRESAEERPRRRGPRPPVRPPTGLTPLLRLVGLISFAILIVLLLIFWVNGCREDQRKDTYKNYVENVEDFATQSQRLGKSLNTLADDPGNEGGRRRERAVRAGAAAGASSPSRLGGSTHRARFARSTSTCSTRSTSGRAG